MRISKDLSHLIRLIVIPLVLCLYPVIIFAQYKHKTDYKMERVVTCQNNVCDPFRFLGSVVGGAAFVKMGESQEFTNSGTTYSYDPDTGSQTKTMWGATVGEEFRFYPDWAVDVTVGYYQLATIRAEGAVAQGSSAYLYQYNVNSKQYLVEAKLMSDMSFGFHAYGLLGIGAAINTLGNYAISTDNVVDPPIFESNVNYNFAYSVGLGVEFDIIRYARIGMGYRFVGLGPAQLESGMIGTTPMTNTIGQTTLNSQEVIAQLTFMI